MVILFDRFAGLSESLAFDLRFVEDDGFDVLARSVVGMSECPRVAQVSSTKDSGSARLRFRLVSPVPRRRERRESRTGLAPD